MQYLKAGTRHNDVCLDIFGGSGTVAVIAKKLQRDFIIIELNPKYVKDIIVPRMKKAHGIFYTDKIIE